MTTPLPSSYSARGYTPARNKQPFLHILILLMGNAESDQGEREAHEVIKHIPVVGPSYSGVRAAVYAGKGDEEEARKSGIAMGFGTLETAGVFV
ncbi:hypothetical protein FRB94_008070 [Tulasnella sp. JGI-2019a]|nr:hypothetical protein FRB94_008070 [Tulasnella sp. JGI-2019a]